MSRNAFSAREREYNERLKSIERAREIADMRTAVTVEWIPATAEYPPPDELVLASLVDSPAPVLPATFDGKQWLDVRGWPLTRTVTDWAHLPMGMHPAKP